MRIAFDARALGRPELAGRGIGRYVSCLLPELERLGDVTPLRELRRPPAPARLAEAWEHLLLARDVRAAGADVLHTPSIDFASARPGAPSVVTVHDLVPLKRPADYVRTGLKHRLRYAAVRRAAIVVAPSRAVAGDVERLLDVPGERVVIIPEAAAPAFRPVPDPHARLERLGLPGEFLLWVGGLDPPDPRKGVAALARAVAEGEGMPLVLAGALDDTGRALGAPGRVWTVGRLSDEELAALYSAAAALVLPSDEEGFGLTPVEALACGTPVAAYASPAVAETLADADGAALVEPGDLPRLLAAAHALAGSRAEPPARTWADVARATFAAYAAAAVAEA